MSVAAPVREAGAKRQAEVEGAGDAFVVCQSTADLDAPLWTNKQHLMSRLVERGAPVLYVDSLGLRAPGVNGRDLRRITGRLQAWRPHAVERSPRLWRDSPLVVPLHGSPVVRAVNRLLVRSRLDRNRRRLGIRQAVLWTYSPSAVHLFDPEWHAALVYHCVDDLASYPGVHREAIAADEWKLVRMADVCIASSRPLERRLRAMRAREVLYWPNPADTAAYERARRLEPAGNTRPVIGFIGAVQEHKIDIDLVRGLAAALPSCEVRLVGPVGNGLRSSTLNAVSYPSNVTFAGHVDKEALPKEVAGFDVAIIPYRLNAYTEHVFPMKVFEYLAAGLPVVSTPLPSLVGEVEHVRFAGTTKEFAAGVTDALAMPEQSPDARTRRAEYASAFSWDNRVDQAAELLGRYLPGMTRPSDLVGRRA